MSDPVKLVTKPTIADEIIEGAATLLREALADVEAGKVAGIIVLCKEADGMWMHRASGTISVREEIGSLEMLKWDRIARTRDVAED